MFRATFQHEFVFIYSHADKILRENFTTFCNNIFLLNVECSLRAVRLISYLDEFKGTTASLDNLRCCHGKISLISFFFWLIQQTLSYPTYQKSYVPLET